MENQIYNQQININNNFINRVNGLDENSKKIIINNNPFKLKLKLHQEALLYKVLEIDDKYSKSTNSFGLISDKPGSGKTFVVLAMIYYSIKFFNSKGANIIVVPHNIYNQWIDAINNFLGKQLKFICLIEYKEINQLFLNQSILYQNDIIITTPLLYTLFVTTIKSIGVNVRRVFFDEADTMKNLLVNAINSEMTWFISASISSVFDNTTLTAKIGVYELYLPTLLLNECYCKNEFIDSNIKLPTPNIEKFICKDFYIDYILIYILSINQLKYINACDYSIIRNECNGILPKNNQDILKNLYFYSNKVINDCDIIIKELVKNKVEATDVKNKNLKKKEFYKNRLDMIKMLSLKYYLCIECFTLIQDKGYKSECQDYLCTECFSKAPIKCLTCNKSHKLDTFIEEKIYNDKKILEYYSKSSINKFTVLDKIFSVCEEKTIIYSEFKGIHNFLNNYSFENNIMYEELNGGNIKEIDKILNSFKENPKIKILLIDNAYFGVGLNIEYATDIIFFYLIDDKIKNQLIGRAQRYGRKSKLNIWEIYYNNEKHA